MILKITNIYVPIYITYQYFNNDFIFYLCQVLRGHWFFSNTTAGHIRVMRRKRTISLPTDADLDDLDCDESESRDEALLSSLVSKHFTVASDLRSINLAMPQSQ